MYDLFVEAFLSRFNFSWNNIIWNRLSHIQWALSLVVDVRRFDFNFSWNGQEWVSLVTSTMSFVLVWVFCADSTMVCNILFYFMVLSFIAIGICSVTIHLYHDDYHDIRLKYKYFLSIVAISILLLSLLFVILHIMTILSHYYQYFTSFRIFCVNFLSMVCLIFCCLDCCKMFAFFSLM